MGSLYFPSWWSFLEDSIVKQVLCKLLPSAETRIFRFLQRFGFGWNRFHCWKYFFCFPGALSRRKVVELGSSAPRRAPRVARPWRGICGGRRAWTRGPEPGSFLFSYFACFFSCSYGSSLLLFLFLFSFLLFLSLLFTNNELHEFYF